MAEIRRAIIDNYSTALEGVTDASKKALVAALENIDMTNPAEAVPQIEAAMVRICSMSAASASRISATLFRNLEAAQLGESSALGAWDGYSAEATREATAACCAKLWRGDIEAATALLVNRLSYEVNRAAGDSMLWFGKGRHILYARVPGSGESCAFCLMLASRGFVYRSAKTAGMFGHYHANCGCRIVPSFAEKFAKVAGYDPDALYRDYRRTLEGHEQESHLELQTQHGKTTKKVYKTAEYDYRAALNAERTRQRNAGK